MVAMMRYVADLWIDSGKSGSGASRVDNPSKRHVSYQPPRDTRQIVVRLRPDTNQAISGWIGFSLPVNIPISTLFHLLIGAETRKLQIHEDGRQSLEDLIFGFSIEHLSNGNFRTAFHEFGKKVAMYWFAKLLDSPYSRHLARCDNCRAYFAYERAPRVDLKSGVYCSNCQGRGSVRRVNLNRKELNKKMVNAAAAAWGQWQRSHRQPDQREWVSKQVNNKCGTQIQRKWVSQNLKKIKAAYDDLSARQHLVV
jgi:hypothetical protein